MRMNALQSRHQAEGDLFGLIVLFFIASLFVRYFKTNSPLALLLPSTKDRFLSAHVD
jgi:hypothetical protein